MATRLTPPIPKSPVKNNTTEINGAYLQLGILVARLFNLGEPSTLISQNIRKALDTARHDGVGQEA